MVLANPHLVVMWEGLLRTQSLDTSVIAVKKRRCVQELVHALNNCGKRCSGNKALF